MNGTSDGRDLSTSPENDEPSSVVQKLEGGAPPWGNLATLRSMAFESGFDARALSRRLGVSGRQLSRHFKRSLGCSPKRWLKEQRVLTARRMLASAASVKEVAYMLGFAQVSQFCRDYRAYFGHSPSSDLTATKARRATPCSEPTSARCCDANSFASTCASL